PERIASHPGGAIHFDFRRRDGETERVDMLRLDEARLCQIRGLRIAMIFQEPMTSLNPVFTIAEQIIEALRLHNPEMPYAAARERALEALRQVQIKDAEAKLDDYPHRLSGGQRQRVMIAMAMACQPDLLIADEPTTALDVTVQAEILRLMKTLQKDRRMGILFITHDFGVVAQMADRVAVMRRGKIVEQGRLDTLLASPRNDYTRALLDALPENLPRPDHPPPASEKPYIEVRDIKVWFPVYKGVFRRHVSDIKAVDGVNLQIRRGEIVALVGESGCGKTTLGRAILQLIRPTAGDVRIAGDSIIGLNNRQLRPYRRRMQIIFQDPLSSLNPRLTIATTLIEPMAVHGIGESTEERIEIARQTLETVQLKGDHLWRYPHEFSGGQRQRIGIARALVLDPGFIVCDEVTSALDVSVQAEILQMLLQLRRDRQLALLFITHDIGVVEYISDRTLVMQQGRVVEQGDTAQVCGAPTQPYTQKLIAAVPRMPENVYRRAGACQ
ncbi:MAG TPA: ABC transporter ATP-binding protein, partial [Gammaproteobacteria bacterium]|nr:ABC transporter ATP-binding protein [Gammaproteobacteria bacterium]